MRFVKVAVVLAALVALALVPHSALAGGNLCVADPASAPVGTDINITCSGYSANTWINVYAVEPDGRASGIDIYGFFPTNIKTNAAGVAAFRFTTEFPGAFSAAVGKYTFVVQQIGLGHTILVENHVDVTVAARAENYTGAFLTSTVDSSPASGSDVAFVGGGFDPFENVNTWVSQPAAANCSGLGIDQLSLGALGTNSSSLWSGPGTVKADAAGDIAFSVHFNPSACIGVYTLTARALGSGRAAESSFTIDGKSVTASKGTLITVTPSRVVAFDSHLTILGVGYPAGTTVNCWFTRPDGRVLGFISVDAKTDASGSFAVGAKLDDFPPFTSTEPGTWYATCATADHSTLATTWFTVYGLMSDP